MKLTLFALLLFALSACDDGKPYLKQELKYEQLEGTCEQRPDELGITANTIGERYVYEECLPSNYDGSIDLTRSGDTVVVRLGKEESTTARYRITLDIQARPSYKFIRLNGRTYAVATKRLEP